MRKKSGLLFLLILVISTHITLGKNNSKNSATEKNKTKKFQPKSYTKNERNKRSLDEEAGIRAKNAAISNLYDTKYEGLEEGVLPLKSNKIEVEHPFWGTRGRRDDSSSIEQFLESGFPNEGQYNCKNCLKPYRQEHLDDGFSPFWGNRGRRSSDEITTSNYLSSEDLLKNRYRKQEDEPFWGTRGRRMNEVVYEKNQGEDDPFWGSRGRRDENEAFWGNRGRRDEVEPFWGNRGRRQESEPFWGNRGRRDQLNPYSVDKKKRQKTDLKQSILAAIREVQHDIEKLSRLRRSQDESGSFWDSRGRNSQIQTLFNGDRFKFQTPNAGHTGHGPKLSKGTSSNTLYYDRVFAEEPRYIIVERSSRSSAEDDPFFISRGKKKYHNIHLFQAARDRRGSIEELVKSVRNDPYYIARGKKDTADNSKMENSTILRDDLGKAKDLICATLDLISRKNDGGKVKREVADNDRDRRTILKKLAAQLQIDPYFVSRGKKSGELGVNDELDIFINEISAKCH